jgi:hypothetical protein
METTGLSNQLHQVVVFVVHHLCVGHGLSLTTFALGWNCCMKRNTALEVAHGFLTRCQTLLHG